MDFGEVLTQSFKDYSKNFKLILKTFSILYALPYFLYSLAVAVFSYLAIQKIPSLSAGAGSAEIAGALPFLIIGGILVLVLGLCYMVFLFLTNTTLFYFVLFNTKGDMTFKQAFKGGRKYFWRMLGLTIVLMLAVIGLCLLLIIPGIIFSVFWLFSMYILVSEDTGIIEAMKRSKLFVKGRWWTVFGYLLLFGLLTGVAGTVLLVPGMIIGFIRQMFLGSLPITLVLSTLEIIIRLVYMVLITPFGVVFFKNFYFELKKSRKK